MSSPGLLATSHAVCDGHQQSGKGPIDISRPQCCARQTGAGGSDFMLKLMALVLASVTMVAVIAASIFLHPSEATIPATTAVQETSPAVAATAAVQEMQPAVAATIAAQEMQPAVAATIA